MFVLKKFILSMNIFIALQSICFAESAYVKYDPKDCKEEYKVEDVHEIQDMPIEKLDQKNFGMCYGFAVTNLLQLHFNRSLKKQTTETRDQFNNQLSLIDILSQHNPNQSCSFKEGGNPVAILYSIMKNSYKVLKRSQFPEELQNYELCMKNYFSLDLEKVESLRKEIVEKILKTKNSTEENVLPPFNIYERLNLDKDQNLEILEDNFKKVPPLPTKITINFSQGAHAIVVKGIRNVCCGKVCHKEVNIVNSYGERIEEQGWLRFDAFDINNLTWIRPCQNDSEEKCNDIINSNEPFFTALKLNNLELMSQYIAQHKDFNINSNIEQGANSLSISTLLSDGLLDMSKLLIQLGANINAKSEEGYTPLSYAADKGNIKMMKFYLDEHKMDINTQADDGYSLISLAAFKGHLDSIDFLHARGANLEVPENNGGNTPLLDAVKNKKMDVVKKLISLGANLEAKNYDGYTPLFLAVKQGDTEMVKELLELGANSKVMNKFNQTPLSLAEDNFDQEIFNLLESHE
jgi:hypothetical protein